MSSGTYVIAGGSGGIGLELVRLLAPTASRVDVWSRTVGGLEPGGVIRHAACDFAAADGGLPEPPEAVHGAVYCPGTITLRSPSTLPSSTTVQIVRPGSTLIDSARNWLPAFNP